MPRRCQVSCKEWEKIKLEDSKGKKVKRKQATLVTRKSLPGPGKGKGDDDDDSEDDFKPTKTAAKPKKPAEVKQVRARPIPVVPSNIEMDDDDDDVPPPPPRKRAPMKKTKDESESDFYVTDQPAVKKFGKVKAIKVDSDSEVEVVPGLPAKGKGASKRKR
jgi:DNA topoisomerase II